LTNSPHQSLDVNFSGLKILDLLISLRFEGKTIVTMFAVISQLLIGFLEYICKNNCRTERTLYKLCP